MKVTVRVDGELVETDAVLEFDALTLQQAVRLEQTIGADRMAVLMSDTPQAGRVASLPSTIRALFYAQLKDEYPDMAIDDINLTIADLAPDDDETDEGVPPLVMELPDGTTIDDGGGASEEDPTTAVSAAAS